jgi:hypothetical protein
LRNERVGGETTAGDICPQSSGDVNGILLIHRNPGSGIGLKTWLAPSFCLSLFQTKVAGPHYTESYRKCPD